MAQSKGKFILYLAGAGVLGALAYFGFKAWRKTHPKDGNSGSPDQTPTATDVTKPTETTGGGSPINYTTNPFKTKDEVKAFQQWIVNKYGKILGTSGSSKNGVDGLWGQKTASAWDKYGKAYMTTVSTTSTTTTDAIPSDVQKYIDYIAQNGQGTKANRQYLVDQYKKSPEFISGWLRGWATTMEDRLKRQSEGTFSTAFAYKDYGVWDSYFGVKRAEKSPLNRTATTVSENSKLWSDRFFGSGDISIPKGYDLGQIKDFSYSKKDNALFLYVPNNGYSNNKKWAIAPYTKF